jgi:hypothetical protein
MKWCQKPFRLDLSLKKDDPDYYTAIYSSKIEKFQYLFDTLRGNRESYFTAGERSLLTHHLLSRAHSGNDNDDDDLKPVIRKPGLKFYSIISNLSVYIFLSNRFNSWIKKWLESTWYDN